MKSTSQFNRRQWLAASGGLVAASYLPDLRIAQQEQTATATKRLKMLTTDPRNGEPALGDLVKSWITPTQNFYVRSHAPNPVISPDTFRVRVQGAVRKPLELSLGQLASMQRRIVTATMTCAGNRRTEFNAQKYVGGVQWGPGAIGNAVWGGVALADILTQAEIKENAKHVWFEGLDQIQRSSGVIPFGASIPIEKAMLNNSAGRVLLCDQMNGQPLTADHGFPLRTVVPGYIGARSVKWLGKIIVSDRPSPNHYVANAYKIVREQTAMEWNEAGPIYRFPINAVICSPEFGANIPPGQLEVSGYALPTGISNNKIQSVDVSVDGGSTWNRAEIQNQQTDFCWSLWSTRIPVDQSAKEIIVKASDTSGNFMPHRVPWNAKGYLQNSWFRLPINS